MASRQQGSQHSLCTALSHTLPQASLGPVASAAPMRLPAHPRCAGKAVKITQAHTPCKSRPRLLSRLACLQAREVCDQSRSAGAGRKQRVPDQQAPAHTAATGVQRCPASQPGPPCRKRTL